MKKLLFALFAVSLATAGGVAFAEEDEMLTIAPNALQTVTSTPPSGPAVYDREDEAMQVAPNATMVIEQTTYTWGTYPTD